MTKAEIIISTRNLVNFQTENTVSKLTDAVLTDLINDSAEDVVLDLIPLMAHQFLGTETITLVAGTANYSLTSSFLQIYKVEKNVTSENPTEITIIDPLDKQFVHYIGETIEEPDYCYLMGDTIYFVPTPSAAKTNYATVYFIRPEASSIAETGPVYIPRVAQRLIVYKAAANALIMYDENPGPYIALYQKRLIAVARVWAERYHQKPRFVRPSVHERATLDSRDRAFYDISDE